ncbi:cysteine dioxygenase family protein [Photobacterium angustum]|uniref:cysteine dioxygenase n=1 Tax=Photobacterium angustum TaxID=661 RepID=UPI003D1061EE
MKKALHNKESQTFLKSLISNQNELSYQDIINQLAHTKKTLSKATIRYILENLYIDEKEIRSLAEFEIDTYCRKRLFKNAHCEVLILSWLNGQRSKIHDHLGSICGVKILSGQAIETTFVRIHNQHIFAIKSEYYEQGDVIVSIDNDIHQISNLQDNYKELITLHIYSPPLQSFRQYQLETAKTSWFSSKNSYSWFYEI